MPANAGRIAGETSDGQKDLDPSEKFGAIKNG
jgi:hypothetical protein